MKVSIIGAGSYGTALAQLISNNSDQVFLYARDRSVIKKINTNSENTGYFPSLKLNSNIKAVELYKDTVSLEQSDVIIFSLPSGVTGKTAKKLTSHIKDKLIISTSKGIEYPSLNTMSQAITKATGNKKVICFSGPTFADELIQGYLSGFTIGATKKINKDIVSSLLQKPNVIYDFSNDVIGVELCGVLKNIYSISIGIFDSFSFSNNEHYTFLSLCFKEMNQIIDIVAKDKGLYQKFCCFGDFNLTTNTDKSRNRTLGLMVGKGLLKLNEFNPSIIFEGMKSVKAVRSLSKKFGIKTPIVDFTFKALNNKVNVTFEIDNLLKGLNRSHSQNNI